MQKNPKQSDRLQVGSTCPTADSLSESIVHSLTIQRRSRIWEWKKIIIIKYVRLKMVQGCWSWTVLSRDRNLLFTTTQCCSGRGWGVSEGSDPYRDDIWGVTGHESSRSCIHVSPLGTKNFLSTHLAIEVIIVALKYDTSKNSQNRTL